MRNTRNIKKLFILLFCIILYISCISCMSCISFHKVLNVEKEDLFYYIRDMSGYSYYCPICGRKGWYKKSAGSSIIDKDIQYHHYNCIFHSWIVIWENSGKGRNNLIVDTKVFK